jgi:hypothetical protein
MPEKSKKGLILKEVEVKRGGKTFKRKQWVRASEDEPEPKKGKKEIPKSKGLFNIGDKISFMGNNLVIMKVSESEKTIKLSDGKVYTFGAIEKFSKPKEEVKKEIPKKETKIKDLKPIKEKEVKPKVIISKEEPKAGDFLSFENEDAKKKIQKYIKTKEFKKDKETQKSIHAYTLTHYGYMNSYLRDNDLLGGDKEEIEGYINKFSSFLDDAPKVEGTFYRGMYFYKSEKDNIKDMNKLISNIESTGEGGNIEFPAFTSTAANRVMAEAFAEVGKSRSHSMIVEIETKKGVYLNGLSPISNEITLNKGSKFKIVSFDKSDPDNMILKLVQL